MDQDRLIVGFTRTVHSDSASGDQSPPKNHSLAEGQLFGDVVLAHVLGELDPGDVTVAVKVEVAERSGGVVIRQAIGLKVQREFAETELSVAVPVDRVEDQLIALDGMREGFGLTADPRWALTIWSASALPGSRPRNRTTS